MFVQRDIACENSSAALQALNTEGWVDPSSKSKKAKKNIDFSLHSLWGNGSAPVIQPEVYTASGAALLMQQQHDYCMSKCSINVAPHNLLVIATLDLSCPAQLNVMSALVL